MAGYFEETLGLKTYFPRLRRHRTIRRVRRLVTAPLFPRYLFCQFDPRSRYRAVQFAPDVIGIVAFGGAPAVVDDGIISGLMAWAGAGVDLITLEPELRPGDPVEIRDGPMRGLQAVMLPGRSDGDRVMVLLSILEREVPLVISRTQLARAS